MVRRSTGVPTKPAKRHLQPYDLRRALVSDDTWLRAGGSRVPRSRQHTHSSVRIVSTALRGMEACQRDGLLRFNWNETETRSAG
jgi:hypothetical protein